MGKDPAMPFYVNDWLSSPRVQSMTQEQELGFFRLLAFGWASQEAAIPDDDETLMRLGRFKSKAALTVVRRSFNEHPTKAQHLTNDRLLFLWNERKKWKEQRKNAGKSSGEKRRKQAEYNRLHENERALKSRSTKPQRNGNSSSSSSSSSSSYEFPLPPFSDSISQAVRDVVTAWLATKAKPYKPQALKALATRVENRIQAHGEQALVEAITRAMSQGYKGWDFDDWFAGKSAPADKIATADDLASWNPTGSGA